ncbi:hypothetical protein LC612_25205 [Nostoc sp. CHAB 5834]|nr:hypothetical protein [Nostoc sp. CHAB 5834]
MPKVTAKHFSNNLLVGKSCDAIAHPATTCQNAHHWYFGLPPNVRAHRTQIALLFSRLYLYVLVQRDFRRIF